MQTVSRSSFTTVTTEGAILPADLLQRIVDGRELEGLRPEDYHLAPSERLNEAISRSWNRLLGVWEGFNQQRVDLPADDRGTTLTRERWLLILLQELGYGRLPYQQVGLSVNGEEEEGARYPISHEYDRAPLHLVTFRQKLDRADSDRAERFRRSPHSLLQEFLNRSGRHMWGILSNGLRLRLMRDNVSFTRAAYLEFDLEAMMEGEIYADFTLLWLAVHQSRLEGAPETCWLEKWSQEAAEQGTRALDSLRDGVQEAISILGRGFLAHSANVALRQQLQSGDLGTQDYYRQLLRLVYRLIFLFVAEDRNLLLVESEGVGSEGVREAAPTPPLPHSPTPPEIRQRYMDYYSVTRLRELAARRRSGPHPDLYRSLRLVMVLLRQGYPPLGLPGLGSYLFSKRSTPNLDQAEIANEALLDAVRALAFTIQNRVLRPVDYKNLGAEELGSVYESLLELHPELNVAAATFDLKTAAGSERKTTGSYYTPTSLINSLLDTALEPVVEDRLRQARKNWELGSRGVGSRGVGSKGVRDEQDRVISRLEGMARGDDSGGKVLQDNDRFSASGTIRDDLTDQASGSLSAGQHSRGLRPGDEGRLHSISTDRPGLSEGTRDADCPVNTSEPGDATDDPTAPGTKQDGGRDASLTDSGPGTEEIRNPSLPHSPTPPLPQALEDALLSIKVVDPAAGSGHFLIAAANRLARHLARIRTGDEEPSPEAARKALRDVVRHCIHGVDINEMAVELCKVGLWLETLDPGRPLSFLDANIQQGNSLIGATPALLDEGIPGEAFTPVTGDDKGYAREFKALNREQRKGQMALFKGGQPWQRLGNLAAALNEMAALEGDTLKGVRAQEEAYAALVRSQGYQYGKLWADAWCAAFFWRLLPEEQGGFPYPITEEEFRRIEQSPFSIPVWMREEIERLAGTHHFFHWHLAFPHIFGSGGVGSKGVRNSLTAPFPHSPTPFSSGFDVVLGNPPWERIKLQEKEWFAARSPEIANARNAAARRKLIQALPQKDPALHAAFMRDKKAAENESHFARNSGRYPLSAVGDINTYQLFSGLSRQIRSDAGRVGIIVPSGIASDYYNQDFFNAIVQKRELVSLYDFENRQKLFPEVDSRMKFCLLTLAGPARPAQAAQYLFFAHSAADLQDKERLFTLSSQEIARINPNTRTAPIFRSRRDAELTKAIYRRVPILIEEGPPERNPWGVNFLRMFDMSNDSHLFRTREQLEAEGWRLEGNRFVKEEGSEGVGSEGIGSKGVGSRAVRELPTPPLPHSPTASFPHSLSPAYLPLYEAKMLHHFNHRWATYEGLDTRDTTPAERDDPAFTVLPRYWVRQEEVDGRLDSDQTWLLGFRDIARSTDERTAIFSTLPRTAVGNKVPVLLSDLQSRVVLQSGLSTAASSFAFDFTARQKLGGTTMNFFIAKQLPFLPPETYTQPCPWHSPTPSLPTPYSLSSFLLPRAVELTYTAYDLRPFAQDCGYHGPPFRWHEERRFWLRAELDAAYFHLYGIEREDVDYIMDTFPIVRRKDEAEYGEYRTKRVILEIYDEMAEAIATGQPYQTRLDPPPAHPDAASPWDEEYLGPELPKDQWWQEVELSAPVESAEPKPAFTSSPAKSAVKEPAPSFELKPPPSKQAQPKAKPSTQPAQPALVTDFTPPQGSRSQRLKQVMALGDRVKANRQDALAISQLVAALGDSDDSIRWLAGSALKILSGHLVVATLAAYLKSDPGEQARGEALRVLGLIAETDEDEAVRGLARKLLS